MTGTIRRRGTKSWELKWDGARGADGKRKTRYRSFKGTKREAQSELTRLLAAEQAGQGTDPSRETLGEFLDRWLADWASSHVSAKTHERYGELVERQIKPHLGSVKAQKLRAADIQALYTTLLKEGRADGGPLSARTVGHVHRVLRRALGHAMLWGIIAANPASAVEPPQVDADEIKIMAPEQASMVLERLKGRSIFPIVLLAMTTGARRGEILGLRWCDLDLETGRMSVNQSLEQTKAAGLRFKPPKTRAGRRMVGLPAFVVAELRTHRKAAQELRLKLGEGRLPDDGLVFCRLDGSPIPPNSVTTEWRRLVTTLELPKVSFHSLRHFHASTLIASGVDLLTVSRRIGHAKPSITANLYGHVFGSNDEQVAAIIEGTLGKAGK